jgi:hypothetical protein
MQCTQANTQLDGVPALLASAPYPPMPDYLTVRIETAIAAEVRVSTANIPASEAHRRDLPERRSAPRAERSPRGWRLPGLSMPATRAVAGAAAAIVVAAGAFGAIANLGGGGQNSASSNAAAGSAAGSRALMPTEQVTYGPMIGYGHNQRVRTVSTGTDFVPAKLGPEVRTAMSDARQSGVAPGATGSAQSHAAATSLNSAAAPSNISPLHGTTQVRLGGCVGKLAAAAKVLLVEVAKYEGRPAAVVVVAAARTGAADVWIVGLTCSATNSHVLDHQVITHI